MAVSRDDVRHIARLARVGVAEERLDAIVAELNGILAHMESLQRVVSAGASEESRDAREGMPLADDVPAAVTLERAREAFAPKMQHGFFLVPRLATHEDAAEES